MNSRTEAQHTGLPAVPSLGRFRADTEQQFSFSITVPEDCTLTWDADGIEAAPTALRKGENQLTITLAPVRKGIQIYTGLQLSIGKRILLSGMAVDPAGPEEMPGQIYTQQLPQDVPPELFPPAYPAQLPLLQRGQRISLGAEPVLQICLACEKMDRQMEIDGYAFLLNKAGKVQEETDLIFWGNPRTMQFPVCLISAAQESFFRIQTSAVTEQVDKIVICYSIYGEEADGIFRYVHAPYLRIVVDGVESYRFMLQGLEQEKTITAVEIYRYQNAWRIRCVGAGYYAGLRCLCEEYGVEVAD